MVVLVALLACIGFGLLFRISGVVAMTASVFDETRSAMAVMGDKVLSDEQKERLVRRSSLNLIVLFVRITGLLVIAAAVPLLFIWLMDLGGIAPFDAVVDFLSTWQGIGLACLVVVPLGFLWR